MIPGELFGPDNQEFSVLLDSETFDNADIEQLRKEEKCIILLCAS
jgi:hypothetical protein